MKDHGVSAVKVATLKYDAADIKARQKQPHVLELAKSIATLGGKPLNPLVIQKKSRLVLAGRDRLAALLVNGASTVDARQVDADAKEAATIERHENLYRRPVDRDALLAEETAALTKTIETARKEAPKAEGKIPDKKSGKPAAEPKPTGRPKSAAGEAREVVAKKAGTTPEAVRKAASRAEAKKNPPPAKKTAGKIPFFRNFGLALPPTFEEMIGEISVGLNAISKHISFGALTATTKLEDVLAVGEIEAGTLPRLKQLFHDATAILKDAMPEMVCAYCKDPSGEAGRVKTCKACDRRGYLSAGKAQGIPPELLVDGEHAMVSDGNTGFVPLHPAA